MFIWLPDGFSQINVVSIYPRGNHYRATYGNTEVKGNTPYRALMHLVHKLEWDVYLIRYPYQEGTTEEEMRHCYQKCREVYSEFSRMAETRGSEKFSPRDCAMIAEGARMAGERIESNG